MENSRPNEVSKSWNESEKDTKMIYGGYRAENYEEIIQNKKQELETQLAEKNATSMIERCSPEGANKSNLSAVEVFQKLDLDFLPSKERIHFYDSEGIPQEIPNFYAITNPTNNKTFQVSKDQYTTVNHIKLAELFDSMERKVKHVSSIRNGSKIVAETAIDTQDVDGNGDHVQNYLVGINSHDGSSSLCFALRQERLICANQFNFVQSTAGLKLRHTKSINELIPHIKNLIDTANNKFTGNIEDLRRLHRAHLDENGFKDLLENTMKEIFKDRLQGTKKRTVRGIQTEMPKTINNSLEKEYYTIINNMRNEKVNGKFERSAYNIMNGCTQYLTHQSGRLENETARNRARLESLMGGSAAKRINTCRDYLLAHV
tara:strand:+ start:316 stop:1437 length:1122 start_codon:yes stop_codon:yes gene_type:complete